MNNNRNRTVVLLTLENISIWSAKKCSRKYSTKISEAFLMFFRTILKMLKRKYSWKLKGKNPLSSMNWVKKDGGPCTMLFFARLKKFLMNFLIWKLMLISVPVTDGYLYNSPST